MLCVLLIASLLVVWVTISLLRVLAEGLFVGAWLRAEIVVLTLGVVARPRRT